MERSNDQSKFTSSTIINIARCPVILPRIQFAPVSGGARTLIQVYA